MSPCVIQCQPPREKHFKPSSCQKTINHWANPRKIPKKHRQKHANFARKTTNRKYDVRNSQPSTHPTLNFPMNPRWTKTGYCFSVVSVANSSRTAANNPANVPPFEEALKKLESIVEAMESDDLPLETLLAKYEEGSKLVKICREKLSEAELKIQQLEKTADKEMKLKSFETDVEA
jgi:exodeoxyribonuclease VII small subunit